MVNVRPVSRPTAPLWRSNVPTRAQARTAYRSYLQRLAAYRRQSVIRRIRNRFARSLPIRRRRRR